MTTYSIFGAGPAGLFAAWRLINGTRVDGTPLLAVSDEINLYEWGNYSFTDGDGGTRLPAGRICTSHYDNNPANSYIEVGGMRFLEWDGKDGHQLVTKTISALGLDDDVVDFLTTSDPLYYLRGEAYYQSELGHGKTAPYNTPGNNEKAPDDLFGDISKILMNGHDPATRNEQCGFYASAELENVNSFVYEDGSPISNIGYWNFFYDQAGNEGYNYAADGGGYSSNVINWNAANAAIYNGEFAPGGKFKTLKTGYSQVFVSLYEQAVVAAKAAGVTLSLTQETRLHSIWTENDAVNFQLATAADPDHAAGTPQQTDHAFLAMPRHAVELVARATQYRTMDPGQVDFLNNTTVLNHVESVEEQPSYKIAMFFDEPWWENSSYPPNLTNTDGGTTTSSQVFGPTITDLPLRQVYYFGDNSAAGGSGVYGMLASYDDMRFTEFWKQLEISVNDRRTSPRSRDQQALDGPAKATQEMMQMLRLELAKVHYGDPDAAATIPAPLETVFMDWSGRPFGAGYHAWSAHFDIAEVMDTIRTPSKLAGGAGSVYLVGSAYSDDQAWVEGAFCTVESVLVDYFNAASIADTTNYPLICRSSDSCG